METIPLVQTGGLADVITTLAAVAVGLQLTGRTAGGMPAHRALRSEAMEFCGKFAMGFLKQTVTNNKLAPVDADD